MVCYLNFVLCFRLILNSTNMSLANFLKTVSNYVISRFQTLKFCYNYVAHELLILFTTLFQLVKNWSFLITLTGSSQQIRVKLIINTFYYNHKLEVLKNTRLRWSTQKFFGEYFSKIPEFLSRLKMYMEFRVPAFEHSYILHPFKQTPPKVVFDLIIK